MDILTIGDVARRLDVPPKKITDLFYQRKLAADRCPVVGGRRMISPDYVDDIARVLREEGILGEAGAVSNG